MGPRNTLVIRYCCHGLKYNRQEFFLRSGLKPDLDLTPSHMQLSEPQDLVMLHIHGGGFISQVKLKSLQTLQTYFLRTLFILKQKPICQLEGAPKDWYPGTKTLVPSKWFLCPQIYE